LLDLCYEARDIDQDITSQEKIDQWFEAKTKGLTDYAKNPAETKMGNHAASTELQIQARTDSKRHYLDMETKDRLQNGRGNAMLVAGNIYEACKYYELFQAAGFKKCAVVTSYNPNITDIKGETTGEDKPTENVEKYRIYQKNAPGEKPRGF